jgi:hypothetical protein
LESGITAKGSEKNTEDIFKELKLDELTELEFGKNGFTKDVLALGNYALLGVGTLFIDYNTQVVAGDAFAARLCDAESENDIKVTGIRSASLNPLEIPSGATHYILGEQFYDAHEYMSGKSEASNSWSIMFLKEVLKTR